MRKFSIKKYKWPIIVFLSGIFIIWFIILAPFVMMPPISGDPDNHEYASQLNEYRKTNAQIIGGIAFLVGLYLTYRRIKVTEDGQITERFTRAIDQLGSDKMEIRLGAIYALERIAKESPKDHWPIMEILSAYVRDNSKIKYDKDRNQLPCENISTDIQAIMTVIGRRLKKNENSNNYLDFREVNLKGVDLECANLINTNFSISNLEGGNFFNADLTKVRFYKSNLYHANLSMANLTETHLGAANLKCADLCNANLEKANLMICNLDGAILNKTNLKDIIGWSDIKSFESTYLMNLLNTPVGFYKFALSKGALELKEDKES